MAIIKFDTIEDATKVLKEMGDKQIDGYTITMKYDDKRKSYAESLNFRVKKRDKSLTVQTNTLRVRNLAPVTTKEVLQEAFENCSSACILEQANGESLG